jgi:hypothetical protein
MTEHLLLLLLLRHLQEAVPAKLLRAQQAAFLQSTSPSTNQHDY